MNLSPGTGLQSVTKETIMFTVAPEIYDSGRFPLEICKRLVGRQIDITSGGSVVAQVVATELDHRAISKALMGVGVIKPYVDISITVSDEAKTSAVLSLRDPLMEKAPCRSIMTLMLFNRFIENNGVNSLESMTDELWTKLVKDYLTHNYDFVKFEGTPFYTEDHNVSAAPRGIIAALTSGEERIEKFKLPVKADWRMNRMVSKENLVEIACAVIPFTGKVLFFHVEYDFEHYEYSINKGFVTRHDYKHYDESFFSDGECIASARTPMGYAKELNKCIRGVRGLKPL